MALVVNDRVKETSTTEGTGTLNLAGASQDFESFVSGIGTGHPIFSHFSLWISSAMLVAIAIYSSLYS